ncbi:tRNA dimethylallyltransferase [Desulfatibacillum alkenivorans DSM 16219]|uniref:tRNA dimethylallyltransferase n=1 Tax=Desulfatibacillum alkenivorans DSM 16219 TaxID=1121393 RepID=A0A1M6R5S7_9BACT|nr:tRNA (adenosine(37)-N6)-dimethylallyltransferase MiaA [Desulfatibacillum alkenivorans]SHK27793.1 tRNA dimethylallyltransferase [Desulfatibacillum alkenivorans DSM 16219]
MPSKEKIVVIAGPTGVGKSASTLPLAREFGGEIISADAVSVYRCLDIGAAKPGMEERRLVPHHMIDVVDPDEDFDANIYAAQARAIAQSLHASGKRVFVDGGTGFYIKALLHGLFTEGRSDPELRESLRRDAVQLGSHALHDRLKELDPPSAKRIHPNDAYRITRALEICILTGKPASAQQAAHGFEESPYDVLFFCLHRDRKILYQRTDQRVDQMLALGLEQEVRGLLKKGYGPELKSMQSIGYRHMCQYMAGELNYEDAVTLMKRDTRRLAKRQMTWFKAYPEIRWMAPDETEAMRREISLFLE